MSSSERNLQYLLGIQGVFYLATNLWALVETRSFLDQTNPNADLFEARSFAALCLVLTMFFFAGLWRRDLLRPAAFLGLGSSAALLLVELFHLPAIGWSLLWLDFFVELALAALYVAVIFFYREEEKTPEPAVEPTIEEQPALEPMTDEAPIDAMSAEAEALTGDMSSKDSH
jgi:hypothetical protein